MSVSEAETVSIDEIVNNIDKTNSKQLACLKCSSKILAPCKAVYEETEAVELHVMHKKLEDQGVEKEKVKQFFLVEDMYEFDNLGFSHTVGNLKYLTCADCEIGPIGWHSLETKKTYVALSRVKHE